MDTAENPDGEKTSLTTFAYVNQAQRVVFGAGSMSKLGAELGALGLDRVLVLCTPGQHALAELVRSAIGSERVAGIFDRATMHVPMEVAREACDLAKACAADGVVAIGGGSTIGLGKALALELGLPTLAIPTTYAGSEMTAIYGLTEGRLKRTGTDPRVLPRTVLYDPDLTFDLPVNISITSALNAIAHGAEGLYGENRNPVTNLMAEAGIAALARAIPILHGHGDGIRDIDEMRTARSDALYGAWLCGSVLGKVSMALHHKLCHTLGGSFNLSHADVHSVILPHALAYNEAVAPEAMDKIARALGTKSAHRGMYDLALSNGAPTALRDIGMRESDLPLACELVMSNQYPNPRRLEMKAIGYLLRNAFEGNPPQT